MKITIEAFGPARLWLGSESIEVLVASGASVADVADLLAARYPEFAANQRRCAFALIDAIVPQTQALGDGVRLSLIPPVSGG